jgi:hypothetical protein
MQPGRDGAARLDGSRFPGKDKECCLESILRGMRIAQDALADTQYHRTVPGHEGGKGCLIPVRDESREQEGIARRVRDRWRH